MTDSSGVQLVRNLDPSVDTLAVELVEQVRIGTAFGAEGEQFHLVTGIALDSQGRIFIADQGTQAVRVFERQGRFVRKIGRRGDGPGEFTLISRLVLWRDTVHVQNVHGRFTGALFDTTGRLLATYTGRSAESLAAIISGGHSGWFIGVSALVFDRNPDPGTVTENYSTVARIAADDLARSTYGGPLVDSLRHPVVTYRTSRTFWRVSNDGAVRGQSAFFDPVPATAVDGRGLVYLAGGWPYSIDVFDSDGALVRRITRAHDSVLVTDDLVAALVTRAKAHYDTMGQRGRVMYDAFADRAALPRVGFVPVTGRVHAAEGGWLWVQRPDLEVDLTSLEWSPGSQPRPSNWDVFDPDGRFTYTVALPPEFSLHAVTSNSIVGVVRDEDDVQYVVRYLVRLRGFEN